MSKGGGEQKEAGGAQGGCINRIPYQDGRLQNKKRKMQAR